MPSESEKLSAALRLLGPEAVALMTMNAPEITKAAAEELLTRFKVAPPPEAAPGRDIDRAAHHLAGLPAATQARLRQHILDTLAEDGLQELAALTRTKVAALPRVDAAYSRALERKGPKVVRQRLERAGQRLQRAQDDMNGADLALAEALSLLEEEELVAVLEEAAKEAEQRDPLASARRFLAGMGK